jgi:hypothetical protein
MHRKNESKSSNEIQEFNRFLNNIEENSIRSKIIYIELLSILFTIICCIISGILAYDEKSQSALAISIDSFIDILFYVIVIWRYFEQIDCNRKLDRLVLIWLSILFLVSSLLIEFESVSSILVLKKPIASKSFIIISIIQSIVFSLFSILKFYFAKNFINNQVLISSGNDKIF